MTTDAPAAPATQASPDDVGDLVARMRAGERRAIAEVATECERAGVRPSARLGALNLGQARLIGITGPPGAGKSTLVNALIAHMRSIGVTVGVIAVDPSSPISGGAILGDRVRMTAALDDDGVFVRSVASRGALGGLSPAAVRVVDALDAAGFDVILIETVGTGQSEIDIAEVADVRIVVNAPGLGDDIQAMKSGLLEIADILVVNKGDRPDSRAWPRSARRAYLSSSAPRRRATASRRSGTSHPLSPKRPWRSRLKSDAGAAPGRSLLAPPPRCWHGACVPARSTAWGRSRTISWKAGSASMRLQNACSREHKRDAPGCVTK